MSHIFLGDFNIHLEFLGEQVQDETGSIILKLV